MCEYQFCNRCSCMQQCFNGRSLLLSLEQSGVNRYLDRPQLADEWLSRHLHYRSKYRRNLYLQQCAVRNSCRVSFTCRYRSGVLCRCSHHQPRQRHKCLSEPEPHSDRRNILQQYLFMEQRSQYRKYHLEQ